MIELGAGQLLDALSNLLPDDPTTPPAYWCHWCYEPDNVTNLVHEDDCEWVAAADLLQRRDKDRHPTITEASERQTP